MSQPTSRPSPRLTDARNRPHTRVHAFLPLLSLMLLGIFVAGCAELPTIPPEIPLGTSMEQVRLTMGPADHEVRVTPRPNDPRIRYVWEYRDHWHQRPPTQHRWGNWDLYFDELCTYRGWRMACPPPLDASRMALQDMSQRPACPEWVTMPATRARPIK